MKDDVTTETHDIDHLFEVAGKLFADRGFDGVSVREISRAANFSMAAIYHHFRSKERLFDEVCLHKYEDFAHNALDKITDYRRQHSKAASVALAFYDMMIGDEDLFHLLQRDLIAGQNGQPNFRSRPQYQQLIRFIDQLLGLKQNDPASEMKTYSLAALINGYCDFAMANRGEDPVEREAVTKKYRVYLEQFVCASFD